MRAALLVVFCVSANAVILDRIAVVVEKRAIKDSDIEHELRVTAYLNGDPLDFSPNTRRQAVERLIDQTVIQSEMSLGRYPEASEAETAKLFAETRKQRTDPSRYGLTEAEVRQALRRQLTVLRFIDIRFRPRPQGNEPDPFVAWLDETRRRTPVVYKEAELK